MIPRHMAFDGGSDPWQTMTIRHGSLNVPCQYISIIHFGPPEYGFGHVEPKF